MRAWISVINLLLNIRRLAQICRKYERLFWVSQGLLAIASIFTLLIPQRLQGLMVLEMLLGDRQHLASSIH